MVLRVALLGALLSLVAAGGCTTNHDALAKQPKAGANSGGSGGSSGSGVGNTGDVGSQGGRVNPDSEPPGDDVLSIVHGIVDANNVVLCFARLDENGQTDELVGSPLEPLHYGASVVLTELPELSYADDTIQPWVIAGDLSLIDGLSCAEAVALADEEEAKVTPVELAVTGSAGAGGGDGVGGEPGSAGAEAGGAGGAAEPVVPLEMPVLRARPVAAIPAGSLNIGRSILLVLSGCMGGAFYADTIATAVCGSGYEPGAPSLQPVVVKLSRALSFGTIGLQGVQAAQAVGSVDIRASGGDAALSYVFASGVSYGGIEPRPADVRFNATELGVDLQDFGLQAIDDSGNLLFQQAWPEVKQVSGIESIEPARTYTAILLGPSPLVLKQGWWNPPTFSLVDNDPTRE